MAGDGALHAAAALALVLTVALLASLNAADAAAALPAGLAAANYMEDGGE